MIKDIDEKMEEFIIIARFNEKLQVMKNLEKLSKK